MKTCIQCGTEFLPPKPNAKYCKRPCFIEAQKGSKRPDRYKRVELECQACGVTYTAGGRSGKNKKSQYHNAKCAASARWRTGSNCKTLTQVQSSYLAGMIDGEGSIMLIRKRDGASLRLTIANSHAGVLDWCAKTTGVGSIVWKSSDNIKHKRGGTWVCNAQAAETAISQVLPFLIIKKEQAIHALDFQAKMLVPKDRVQKEWQAMYRDKMQAMNKRGPAAEGAA